MGTYVSKPIHISGQAEVFIKTEGKKEVKRGGGKVLYVQTSTVSSDKVSDGLVCIILV